MNNTSKSTVVLPTIIIAQFLCTSLWFAGNAVLADMSAAIHAGPGFLANLTSAVQFGFITGTLVFAIFTIADRMSPSKVFFVCALAGALCNSGMLINNINAWQLMCCRFCTGFFLAGIYPVGMKIAADHFQYGLGKSLGFLVGALVLGTAFPHALKTMAAAWPWKYVIISISALAVIGGCLMFLLVPDGPYRRKSSRFQPAALLTGFSNKHFRAAAFGYFGHMWELYTFWAFVPVILQTNKALHQNAINVPLLSFIIIAGGALSCAGAGILAQKLGARRVATAALMMSCVCCLCAPLFVLTANTALLFIFLFFWGLVVIADSPLFSTLVAQNVKEEARGTSLTIVNCIGFSITIISIQLLRWLSNEITPQYLYWILAVGPAIGLYFLLKDRRN
ncbi:MAG: MFS transporter [Bacteroidetes bacterium]|nr:MFS transporter [Bacteroidota bacterium]